MSCENCKGCEDCKSKSKKKKATWKEETGLKNTLRIQKLLRETQDHDHDTCTCEGCKWWTITKHLLKDGRLFEVVPSWKDMDRNEYLNVIQRTMQYKLDKRDSPKELAKTLKKKGMPDDQAKSVAKLMLAPIHVVMYGKAPSPMGLLRDA